MARISLKNIIGKNKPANSVVAELLQQVCAGAWIEDENGVVVIGDKVGDTNSSFPLFAATEIIGQVQGNAAAMAVANLVNHLIEKELEKKKLGSEVLNLYQEINVIFNFSEKLSQAIEPEVIAGFTLEQARNSIPSDGGVVILWDAEKRQMVIPAFSGEPLFSSVAVKENAAVLLQIGINGQSEIINDLVLLKEKGIVVPAVQSLVYAAMKVKHRIMGAIILAGKDAEQFSAAALKMLVTLALQSSSSIESAMLYEKNLQEVRVREEAILRIYEVTKKFVPNEFLKALGKQVLTDIRLGDQAEKIVTVVFTDIRDFTTLSEKMTPEENFRFVSSFNARLGPIIRDHNGFINQYLGDSIMAIFPDNPEDAILASIAMQHSITAMNKERLEAGLFPIYAGIGMHTGPLIMGITGDENRLDAATISDTVNTAARLEGLTKYYKSPILLSHETFVHLANPASFHLRHLGSVRLKGKRNLLTVIECFDGQEATIFEKKLGMLNDFCFALDLYHKQDFNSAISLFTQMLAAHPEDLTMTFFLDNAIKYQLEGVAENWTGIEEMKYK